MIDISSLTPDELIVYEKLLQKLPKTITDSDYAIVVAFMAMLTVGVNYQIQEMLRQFNVETADEPYLRQLASLVGYTWLNSLTVGANRARLMAYEYRRKYRGTLDSIRNLARASFDEESFYSNAENQLIKIYEGNENPYEILPPNSGHIIFLELPDSFLIQRSDIEEVRPAGTILWFIYKMILIITDSNPELLSNLGQYTIKFESSAMVPEHVAGDDPSVDPAASPVWGGTYTTKLRDIWNRPLVLFSTHPGVTLNISNEYEITPLSQKTTLVGFNFLNTNTDWISQEFINRALTQGIYTVTIINNEIVDAVIG